LFPQVIVGGKTNACHPKVPLPEGWLINHTESHWQTPKTFQDFIEKIVVPYKNSKIAELNLPFDQKALFKIDLHYSHKDAAVLELLRMHHIIPAFVPGGKNFVLSHSASYG
jgi:hypothetical protein